MTRTATAAIATASANITNLTPKPRKPGTDKSMRRMRSKVFTVNVLSFNKKIQVKHDRHLKALALAAKKQAGKGKKGNKQKPTLVVVASLK